MDCDVCIVGTGAAGATIALQLQRGHQRICVLEAGGMEPDALTSSLYELECTDLPIGPESRLRYLGGTTNSWWGAVALLDEIDLGPRPWIQAAPWPLERSELVHHCSRACRLLGIPDVTGFDLARLGGRHGSLVRTAALDSAVLYWPKRPTRFRDVYLRAAPNMKNVSTWLHANVTDIRLAANGELVDRIVVRTTNSRRFFVQPKVAVLACGGIENARLLLMSRSQRPDGIGNDFDQVGRYYMDHPKGPCGVIRLTSGGDKVFHPAYSWGRSGQVRLGLRLSDSEQARQGVLNSYVRLRPILDHPAADVLREVYRRRLGALGDARVLKDLAMNAAGVLSLLRSRAFARSSVRTMQVENFMEQEPRPDNRVRLSDRRDPLGAPRARLDWSISETEMRTMTVLHWRLDEELRRRSIGWLDSPLVSGTPGTWPILRDASHHMGTTRMGTDPRNSVVDPDCGVHGIKNLYVAGSSVFPTAGYANPTLTIVALALRLSDHLARTMPALARV